MKKLLLNLALALVGIGLACVVGELAARVTWRDPPPIATPAPGPDLPRIKGSIGLMKRNVEGIHQGVYYRTNSAGFRGREYSEQPPDGVFRIVIVGDSFTMGQGVLEEHAYPFLLEQALNREPGQPGFEVLNLGVGGFNIGNSVSRLERLGLRFQPDLVVYGFTWNDIRGRHYRESMGTKPAVRQREIYSRFETSPSYLMRLLWPRIKSFEELVDPQPGTMLFELNDNYFDNPEAWNQFESGLDELARIRQEHGVPVVVFVHTALFYLTAFHPFRPIYAAVEAAAVDRDLPVIQSFEYFRGRWPSSLWVNAFNFHPNPAGHELLAEALHDGLRPYLPQTR